MKLPINCKLAIGTFLSVLGFTYQPLALAGVGNYFTVVNATGSGPISVYTCPAAQSSCGDRDDPHTIANPVQISATHPNDVTAKSLAYREFANNESEYHPVSATINLAVPCKKNNKNPVCEIPVCDISVSGDLYWLLGAPKINNASVTASTKAAVQNQFVCSASLYKPKESYDETIYITATIGRKMPDKWVLLNKGNYSGQDTSALAIVPGEKSTPVCLALPKSDAKANVDLKTADPDSPGEKKFALTKSGTMIQNPEFILNIAFDNPVAATREELNGTSTCPQFPY